MGITGLWEVIGHGDVCSIADFAARHFECHKRPLRIVVDEACWRFTNLTPEQVQKIREGEPAANPVEKVILWRILRLLKLNIQLLFVNDGPRRPWKRGKRGGGKLDFELIRLTRQLLDHLKVPHHMAPGEAEAECARLQALGVVDAVWSDDGDALMFGCQTLIRQHKDRNGKFKDQIRIYHAPTLQQKHDLDADSLVLFAMLSGGDYNVQGLRGCGPKTAALLAKREYDLARALCHASPSDLPSWREMLHKTMDRYDRVVEVPWTFPEWKALSYYRNPTVSTHEQLQDLRGLRKGWDKPIDQVKLRVFLRERFHFTTREYMKHITPIFLTRRLARATPEQKIENLAFGIQLNRTRAKKVEEGDSNAKSEAKITFSPMPVVEVDLSQRPPEEDWGKFVAKDGSAYDPTQNIDCEVLHCFLHHGLPEGALEASIEKGKTIKRKRKTADLTSDTSSPSKKHQVTSNAEDIMEQGSAVNASQEGGLHELANAAPKKRGRPPKEGKSGASSPTTAKRKKRKVTEDQSMLPEIAPPPVFKQPRSLPLFGTEVVNLYAGESDLEDDDGAKSMSMPITDTTGNLLVHAETSEVMPKASTFVPGEVISVETLRQLRGASALLKNHTEKSAKPSSSSPLRSGRRSRPQEAEVIDLT